MEAIKLVEKKDEKGNYCESCTFYGDVVYKHLAYDLLWKFMHKSPMYKRITRKTNYNGTQTIVVTYDNGVRSTYTIQD